MRQTWETPVSEIIPEFPKYRLTDDGRVWSVARQKYLTPQYTHGCEVYTFWRDNKAHRRTTNRLINATPVKFTVGKPIYINSEADYTAKVAEVRETIAKML